jgi:hypothetical protein
MLIAAPAWAVDAFCVKGNVAEFKRVPALRTSGSLDRVAAPRFPISEQL